MNLRLSVGIGRTSRSFPPLEPYVQLSSHMAQAVCKFKIFLQFIILNPLKYKKLTIFPFRPFLCLKRNGLVNKQIPMSSKNKLEKYTRIYFCEQKCLAGREIYTWAYLVSFKVYSVYLKETEC